MGKVTLTIHLTEEAQRAALLAGEPAQAMQTYEIEDPELIRRVLNLSDCTSWDKDKKVAVKPDGTVAAVIPAHRGYTRDFTWDTRGGICDIASLELTRRPKTPAEAVWDAERVLSGVDTELARLRDEYQAKVAAKVAEQQKEAAAWAALPLEERAGVGMLLCPDGVISNAAVRRLEELEPAAYHEATVEADRLKAEAKARKAEWARGVERERAAWIAEHGSDRLRKALALGLADQVNRTYKDERLALERPGWRREEDSEDRAGAIEPTEEALAALEEARKQWPDCVLVWLKSDLGGCEALADRHLNRNVVCVIEGGRDTRDENRRRYYDE